MQTVRFFHCSGADLMCMRLSRTRLYRSAGALSGLTFRREASRNLAAEGRTAVHAGENTPYRGETAKGWATRICGGVTLVWPKTGLRSSEMRARRKRSVIRRRVVRDADMAKLLGTTSVCRMGWVAASGLRH